MLLIESCSGLMEHSNRRKISKLVHTVNVECLTLTLYTLDTDVSKVWPKSQYKDAPKIGTFLPQTLSSQKSLKNTFFKFVLVQTFFVHHLMCFLWDPACQSRHKGFLFSSLMLAVSLRIWKLLSTFDPPHPLQLLIDIFIFSTMKSNVW